jgi:hypothetical protein
MAIDENLAEKRSMHFAIVSLAIGGLIFIVAPLTAILAAETWVHSDKSTHVVLLHAWLARVSVAIVTVVSLSSVVLAMQAKRFTTRDHCSFIWTRAALLISIAALLLWLIAAVALLNTTESLLRIFG